MQDDLWWKTTFGGRQPSVEDDLRQPTEMLTARAKITDLSIFRFAFPLFVKYYRLFPTFY